MKVIRRTMVNLIMLTASGLSHDPASFAQTPSRSAKEAAPIDLTGVWVAIVNEDWRWRMLTPPKGDYAGVPLNEEGRKLADSWNATQDGSCKAYGAGALMRTPTRVRITWESTDVLRIESDAGMQVRRLYFANAPPVGSRTLQGRSIAQWDLTLPPGNGWGFGEPSSQPPGGSLKVVTTNLEAGWLRKNGVPYSEGTSVTEYYDRFTAPDGNQWFVVTTIVEDSQYLDEPYITSSHFRREPGAGKWHPRPCIG